MSGHNRKHYRERWWNIIKSAGINTKNQVYWVFDTSFLTNEPFPYIINLTRKSNRLIVPTAIKNEVETMFNERMGRKKAKNELRIAVSGAYNLIRTRHDNKRIIKVFNYKKESGMRFNKVFLGNLIDEVQKSIKLDCSNELSSEDKDYILSVIVFLLNIGKIRIAYEKKFDPEKDDNSPFKIIIASFDIRMIETIKMIINHPKMNIYKEKWENCLYYTSAKIDREKIRAMNLEILPISKPHPYTS